MDGFAATGMDEAAFGEKKGLGEGLRTFDAFPKTKATYTTRHARGGQWTILLLAVCSFLSVAELARWWRGAETHNFSVEKGVGHSLQINLDTVVAMRCGDLHVNVQDASGDRILAGEKLKKDDTAWAQWAGSPGIHTLGAGVDDGDDAVEVEHVQDVLGAARGRRKFARTPRLRGEAGACRIYGSLELNKVQGDFHITARGHGYMDFGQHMEHDTFNFSHIVNELSFGPFYPSLTNPLDSTVATTPSHFFKYQYFLSIVPTIYTARSSASRTSVATNQYAVTSQSYAIGERSIPGIFFKFDIEPILLLVRSERQGFLAFLLRVVNVVSGVLVAGGWGYGLVGWAADVLGRRRAGGGEGVLNGRVRGGEEQEE
ncbi:MAG: hypothetical protein M1832_003906 [Thelocarpon impressellum]|nr:MAG: hypothetical protein M1832_003906 [Thelocarpon impressellum]